MYGISDNQKQKRRLKAKAKRRPYRKYVIDICAKCGFKPEHKCQLDIDHIDGNHNNNEESNLQTLCANCHRLKTHLERTPGD